MKRLKDIRRSGKVRIEEATIHGGSGEIEVGGWKGSVVWDVDKEGMDHVSVSPYNHNIMPTWDDMCQIKDIFFEDEETAFQIHPPKSQYVNLMQNCLHLWRPTDGAMKV